LAEQARAWVTPVSTAGELEEDADDANAVNLADPAPAKPQSRAAGFIANRLPKQLRVPALRVVELALRESLGELILAVDPEHPQALYTKWQAAAGQSRDFAVLRRVIASAPGWARPYSDLTGGSDNDPLAPTPLETVAGAGVAAMCRPGQLDVIA